MERGRILRILQEHERELKAAGLLHLRLFGSVARGDNTPGSDVDLRFDYDETNSWNLFLAYGLQDYMTEILQVEVHLSSARHLRPELGLAVTSALARLDAEGQEPS